MAVVDARDERAQLHTPRVAGQVGQGGVALEHGQLGRADEADLEVMIHHRDSVEAELISGLGDPREVLTEAGRTVGRGEVADGQANAHGAILLDNSYATPLSIRVGLPAASVTLPRMTAQAPRAAGAADATDVADTAEIIDLANELVGRLWAHFAARAAELNLSTAEAKALQHLEPDQAMPMRVLAARVHANPSNVTVIVSRLEARGLLSREVSADRRVKGVRLTRAGVALRARLARRLLANHPAVVGLSSDEQRSLLHLLRRLTPPA
jgi:MarR family transcriptional regulator, organic hydroperoxide resistance regulator